MPTTSRLIGAAVVFFLFATMGFVIPQMDIVEQRPGIGPIKSALAQNSGLPLPELFDDQTILLVRHLS